ncbi:hypothetical protein CR513_56960, partial [Mucuna pruriens]
MDSTSGPPLLGCTYSRLLGCEAWPSQDGVRKCMTRSNSNNLHKFDPEIDRTLYRLRKARSANISGSSSFIYVLDSVNNTCTTNNSDFVESSSFDNNSKPNISNNKSHELEQMENNNRTLKELATSDEEADTDSNNLKEAEIDSNNLDKAETNSNNLDKAKTDSKSQSEAESEAETDSKHKKIEVESNSRQLILHSNRVDQSI